MSWYRYMNIECGAATALSIFSITSTVHLFLTYCTHVMVRRHCYRVLESKTIMIIWSTQADIELSAHSMVLYLLYH